MKQRLPFSLGEVLLLKKPMNIKDRHIFLASSCLFLHVVADQASNFVKLRIGGKRALLTTTEMYFPLLVLDGRGRYVLSDPGSCEA